MLALSNAAAGAVAGILGRYGLWGVVCRGLLCGHVPTQHAPGCHCPAHAVQCVFYSRIQFYHTVLYVSVPDFGLHFFFLTVLCMSATITYWHAAGQNGHWPLLSLQTGCRLLRRLFPHICHPGAEYGAVPDRLSLKPHSSATAGICFKTLHTGIMSVIRTSFSSICICTRLICTICFICCCPPWSPGCLRWQPGNFPFSFATAFLPIPSCFWWYRALNIC